MAIFGFAGTRMPQPSAHSGIILAGALPVPKTGSVGGKPTDNGSNGEKVHMRKTICLLAGLLALAMMQSALAAKRLGPPIEDLQSTPDRIRIVVASVREKPAEGNIQFVITERLSGEAPDEVLLRTDADTFAGVTVGDPYVVAWTYMRRNRRVIGGWEEDPEGPSTVSILGLGSTAVFEATPEMRYLFTPGSITDATAAGKQTDALLAQMKRDDPRARGLVISELWLRKDLTEKFSLDQAKVLQEVLQSKELDNQHRQLLYEAGVLIDPALTSPWLAEDMRKTIRQHGTEYDLLSFVPSLVISAAEGLRQLGNAGDIELLGTLLYANNPGVSKAALAAIDHFDPAAATARAEQALQQGGIHPETRQAMARYLTSGQIR
jgi:hypothetical protein